MAVSLATWTKASPSSLNVIEESSSYGSIKIKSLLKFSSPWAETVETAGKHVSRALDRLTDLRGRHSHVVTAVSLGTMLTSEMAKAARSLLTASLATDSLSVT
ncbi:hypothetical protein OAL27_00750 [Verrucomicrobiales bacterium]|jgi:hypothetical protein|nr:hypothetical protein [bacterium]MDC0312461.1 hypothetical protein [Verrucomicrobiales bacterium]MDF1786725.1 hypothetical protein [Verrucomicrobiales bacterium]